MKTAKEKDIVDGSPKASDVKFAHDYLSFPPLDLLTGGLGLPYRRMMVVVGKKETGKSTFLLQLTGEVIRQGGKGVWIDTEKTFDDRRAESLGVDLNQVIYHKGGSVEEVFSAIRIVMDTLQAKQADYPCIVVWDSFTATATSSEVDGDPDKALGRHARGFSSGSRLVKPFLGLTEDSPKIILAVVNQWREAIGTYHGGLSTFGGNPVEQNVDMILVFRGREYWKLDSGVPYAQTIGVKTDKCRFWYRGREVPMFFDFATGFDKEMSVWLLAKDLGIVERRGSMYVMPDGSSVRQKEVVEMMKGDAQFFGHIWDLVRTAYLLRYGGRPTIAG